VLTPGRLSEVFGAEIALHEAGGYVYARPVAPD
jgi:hypothetical protein